MGYFALLNTRWFSVVRQTVLEVKGHGGYQLLVEVFGFWFHSSVPVDFYYISFSVVFYLFF